MAALSLSLISVYLFPVVIERLAKSFSPSMLLMDFLSELLITVERLVSKFLPKISIGLRTGLLSCKLKYYQSTLLSHVLSNFNLHLQNEIYYRWNSAKPVMYQRKHLVHGSTKLRIRRSPMSL